MHIRSLFVKDRIDKWEIDVKYSPIRPNTLDVDPHRIIDWETISHVQRYIMGYTSFKSLNNKNVHSRSMLKM